MSSRAGAVWRWVAAILALAAIACFFLPLFRLHVPMKKDRELNGPGFLAEVVRTVQDLRTGAESAREEAGAEGRSADRTARRLPASVRLAWLFAVTLLLPPLAAAASALTAPWLARGARAISAAGAALSLAALAHMAWLNWQVHGMYLDAGRPGFHPFSRLAARIGGHLASKFEMAPETGLYGMAVVLALVTAAAWVGARGTAERG